MHVCDSPDSCREKVIRGLLGSESARQGHLRPPGVDHQPPQQHVLSPITRPSCAFLVPLSSSSFSSFFLLSQIPPLHALPQARGYTQRPCAPLQWRSGLCWNQCCPTTQEFQAGTKLFEDRAHKSFCSVTRLCLTFCDPVDCSMPGSPITSLFPGVCSNSCPLSQ